ncbi:MAG: hypothetical protein KDK65_05275 [Chlamydiia bacterium]|nr:hypothetical protein [Chlamydiia bacterium]
MMSYFFPTPPTEISAQVWPTSDPFPEADLVKDMPNVDVAISGGGTRSVAAAIGQLAAL